MREKTWLHLLVTDIPFLPCHGENLDSRAFESKTLLSPPPSGATVFCLNVHMTGKEEQSSLSSLPWGKDCSSWAVTLYASHCHQLSLPATGLITQFVGIDMMGGWGRNPHVILRWRSDEVVKVPAHLWVPSCPRVVELLEVSLHYPIFLPKETQSCMQ